MTATITPIRSVLIQSGLQFKSGAAIETSTGSKIVQGLRVFKAGTFRDSEGVQRTWTIEQLHTMVQNFDYLKENRLMDPPVRKGHPGIFGSGGEVAGYIHAMRVAGQFLEADFEFTEPDAYDKYKRGTYRARSLEVGLYKSNDDVPFYPTVLGVAFVDIGAVEGLYSRNEGVPSGAPSTMSFAQTIVDDEKESQMPTAEELAAAQAKAEADQATADAAAAAAATAQAEADAAAAAAVEAQAAADARMQEAETQLAAAHAAASGGMITFSVAGQTTSDMAVVQSHISALELFQADTIKSNRENFIKKLSDDKKIIATQVEPLTALALSFSADQFKDFCASYESAPQLGLFQPHGGGGDGAGGEGHQQEQDERATLEETVAMHKRAGMLEEQLHKTSAYTRLQALIST